ncbi:MAG: hypothetical protein E7647_07200 [Ruminococcaceae bacterium]|nr:hypothetical protein [Oscillospiraceae bacterium]
MKKLLVIALALVMCLSALAGCSKKEEPEAPSGMKLASGDNVDYYMYVPEMWRVDKSDLYTSANFSSGDPTSISATAYAISSDIKSVGDWWAGFEKEMATVYTEISEVEETDAKLDGIKGKEYAFTASLAGQKYNFIITAVIKDYYVYYITYTSVPEYNENHLKERTQMVEAFKFEK